MRSILFAATLVVLLAPTHSFAQLPCDEYSPTPTSFTGSNFIGTTLYAYGVEVEGVVYDIEFGFDGISDFSISSIVEAPVVDNPLRPASGNYFDGERLKLILSCFEGAGGDNYYVELRLVSIHTGAFTVDSINRIAATDINDQFEIRFGNGLENSILTLGVDGSATLGEYSATYTSEVLNGGLNYDIDVENGASSLRLNSNPDGTISGPYSHLRETGTFQAIPIGIPSWFDRLIDDDLIRIDLEYQGSETVPTPNMVKISPGLLHVYTDDSALTPNIKLRILDRCALDNNYELYYESRDAEDYKLTIYQFGTGEIRAFDDSETFVPTERISSCPEQ